MKTLVTIALVLLSLNAYAAPVRSDFSASIAEGSILTSTLAGDTGGLLAYDDPFCLATCLIDVRHEVYEPSRLNVVTVPVPSSLLLFPSAFFFLIWLRRKR